jgi:hypothetical protein
MRKLVTLTAAIVFVTSAHSMAENVVMPNNELPLRAGPPGTFFKGKGDRIGTVSPKEHYRVLERKSIPTVVGTEQWLRVQSVDDPNKQGWIYAGKGEHQTVSPR